MNYHEKFFGTPELTAMTIADMEAWFIHRSDEYLKEIPGDTEGILSACIAELLNSGGYTIYGAHATLKWLKEEVVE